MADSRWQPSLALLAAAFGALAACSTLGDTTTDGSTESAPSTTTRADDAASAGHGSTAATETTEAALEPTTTLTVPDWLGQRPLATDIEGFGIAQPTPPELIDRHLPTIDILQPPSGDAFDSSVQPLAGEPLERSTWQADCPVDPGDLSYVTVAFWGFDGRPHTGELIVAAEWAEDIVGVFDVAWRDRFPIEEMRIVTRADLDAAPTGDGNNTASYVCRPVTGGSRFSEHAHGLAIDVNPFHNPYLRDGRLLPELAGSYLEREDLRDGMLTADSAVVRAFKALGWSWGGEWSSLKDWQHFSQNGQ